MIHQLQRGYDCIRFQSPLEDAELNGIVVGQVHAGVAAAPPLLDVLQHLLGLILVAVPTGPTGELILGSAGEDEQLVPVALHQIDDAPDHRLLLGIMLDDCWQTAPKIVNNYFYDLRKTMYLNFDKAYWNQSFNEVMSYNDAQYAVTGAMTLSLYRNTFVTVFNKDLFTTANQPFLYEYVENGTWTLDKQASLIPLFHQDNGNGEQDASGDIYGFITNDFVYVDPYWASCEIKILNKNGDGEYEWAFNVNKLHDMADKVLNLFYGTDGAA